MPFDVRCHREKLNLRLYEFVTTIWFAAIFKTMLCIIADIDSISSMILYIEDNNFGFQNPWGKINLKLSIAHKT